MADLEEWKEFYLEDEGWQCNWQKFFFFLLTWKKNLMKLVVDKNSFLASNKESQTMEDI